MSYTYKGVRCLKSPVDISIYMRLIWDLKPRSLFEIGSHSGGSALLFADILGNMGCPDTPVISIDLEIPQDIEDDRIRFLKGNVLDLASLFDAHKLDALPHPWFVIEDSAHSYSGCMAALTLFAERMAPGDMLAVEDGVLDDLGMSAKYDGGPNRAISDFVSSHAESFEIATHLCDMFGVNATYNPNGYLRKV
ncbi:MAG: CmcI family methyltransferase [Rhodobacterales bacterium]